MPDHNGALPEAETISTAKSSSTEAVAQGVAASLKELQAFPFEVGINTDKLDVEWCTDGDSWWDVVKSFSGRELDHFYRQIMLPTLVLKGPSRQSEQLLSQSVTVNKDFWYAMLPTLRDTIASNQIAQGSSEGKYSNMQALKDEVPKLTHVWLNRAATQVVRGLAPAPDASVKTNFDLEFWRIHDGIFESEGCSEVARLYLRQSKDCWA